MGRAGRVNGANIARSPSNVSFSNDEEKLEFLRERGILLLEGMFIIVITGISSVKGIL